MGVWSLAISKLALTIKIFNLGLRNDTGQHHGIILSFVILRLN